MTNVQNAYIAQNPNRGVFKHYAPVIVPGEVTKFYINFNDIFVPDDDLVEFSEWTLAMIDYDLNVYAIPDQQLSQVFIGGGTTFHVYGEFVTPEEKKNIYRLIIYKQNNNVVKYVSNCLFLRPVSDCPDNFTLTLEYRNTIDYFDYLYSQIPDFYNTIRVHLNQINPPANEEEVESQQEISTGTRRLTKAITERYLTLEALDFDDKAQEAGLALSSHDTIKLNGENYLRRTKWEPVPSDRRSPKRKAIWEVYKLASAQINRSCS